MIPKNIFFYWEKDVPVEVVENINNYKLLYPDFNVILLNDTSINKYSNEFPTLIKLFHSATIAALKSDIIRFLVLYNEGGMWLDSNTTLINNNAINILFERYKDFEFVITLLPIRRNDMKTSALISKPKSKFAFDTLCKLEENLLRHYKIESQTKYYFRYNFFMFVAPVIWFELLDYKFEDNQRIKMFHNVVKDSNDNIITLNIEKFNKYNCGLMVTDNLIRFYGCNMEHHHGKNFHKHWSQLQQTQRLFDTNKFKLF